MKLSKFFVLPMLLLPLPLWAKDFSSNLYFGLRNNQEVIELQNFLKDQGLYQGPVNGNFFSLTQAAVKKFQEREKIEPAAGYFGAKTRKIANSLLTSKKEETATDQISILLAQIKELQEKLNSLQSKTGDNVVSQPVVPVQPSVSTTTAVVTPEVMATSTPQITNKILISGYSTSTFPTIVSTTLKIGDIEIKNDRASDVLLARMYALMYDSMESPPNRGRRVSFILKEGTDIGGEIISQQYFTFFSTQPTLGDSHRIPMDFSLPIKLSAGESRKISFWIEQLQYVNNGQLRIQSTSFSATDPVTFDGGIDFILTKAPSL